MLGTLTEHAKELLGLSGLILAYLMKRVVGKYDSQLEDMTFEISRLHKDNERKDIVITALITEHLSRHPESSIRNYIKYLKRSETDE